MELKFSIIVPVYNRPDEVDELLDSLTKQTDKDFEVVIVEDGSETDCIDIINTYKEQLNVEYYYKENTGPGTSRNYGMERAKGNYMIIFDSDCIIPERYIEIVRKALTFNYVDAYGGPDMAHPSFTITQKAINYSMTSLLTTGGIRGKNKSLEKFHPRSFNMGYSKEVFLRTNGFSTMRFGEDIDMSIRIMNAGFRTRLIEQAAVYHKRRTNIRQFFKQVYNSGLARINLYKRHPESLKLVHFLPASFLELTIILLIVSIFFPVALLPLAFLALAFFVDALIKTKNPDVAFVSIITSFVQLYGYGAGFWIAFMKRVIFRQGEFNAFVKTFYK